MLPLELTDPAAIGETIAHAYAVHGRLDVVLNNAGYGLLGAIEEASAKETEHVFAVNFHGPLAVMKAVLPFLRRQRCGHIVNVSSIAGLAPMAGSGLYAASKCALEGVSEALAQEVAPLGIRITLVEPGLSVQTSCRPIPSAAAKPGSRNTTRPLAEISGIWPPSQASRLAIQSALPRPSWPPSRRSGRRCTWCLARTRCAAHAKS